ncbi:MAG: FdtA/QdtA family cupin domain-containing protein [Romboutsia timonensis]|uniref:sugar 3,4-ketoisomerase n=1 Tax=Romboutsia timonensis TaxID=1776391 RepID=UPI002A7667DC|nr:FdtA/QdtA family cupin domain-containing protein [Romboutsia timonensis]MDY2882890.1 FdtA/QdtA family cupin domain-containing protein [Romboutsia timonensis]
MKFSYKFKLNNKGNLDTGFLVPLEFNTNIPFKTKRIFYSYGVPNESYRGAHAYYNTEQVLICVSGNLKIKCSDKNNEAVYELNKPDEALYIAPNVWRITFEHSPDAVLLVLSSLEYKEEDYIRDYDKFLKLIRK